MEKRPLVNPPNNFNLQSLAYQALPLSDRCNIQEKTVPCLPDTMKCKTNELRLGFQIFFTHHVTWKSEDYAQAMGFHTYPNFGGFDIEGPKLNCTILNANVQGESEFLFDFTDDEIPTIYDILEQLNKLCEEDLSFESIEQYKVVNLSKFIHCGPIILDIKLFAHDGIDMQQLIQFCHHADAWQWQNLQAVAKFEHYFSKLLGTQITTIYARPIIAFNTTTTNGSRQFMLYNQALQEYYNQRLAQK